jgi:vitamin B12 transporter
MVLCLLSTPALIYAQALHDTLQQVNIQSKQLPSNQDKANYYSSGQQIKLLDTTLLKHYELQTMATLIGQETNVFLRTYGFNSLSTLNFRGASAAQSLMLWNGVPVQNAALGIADLSLVPVMLMDKVNVLYGSSSALWGSGNVGGALLLENELPHFTKMPQYKLSFTAGAGSYSNYLSGLKYSAAYNKCYLSFTVFGQNVQNNFSYPSDFGKTKSMSNAAFNGASVLARLAYKANDFNTLSLSAWYQSWYREIPAALFEAASTKNYNSASLKLLGEWDFKKDNTHAYAKASFIKDDMQYSDVALIMSNGPLRNTTTAYQYFQELGYKYLISYRQSFLLYVPLQINTMAIKDSTHVINSVALAAAYNYQWNYLLCSINAREEWHNSNAISLTGISLRYLFNLNFSIRANVQNTYRAPTLNELYYFPGGNTTLKPEQGWSQDIGYNYVHDFNNRLQFQQDLTIYNRDIKDWILWFGGAVWTPHNMAEVQSRGLETDNSLCYKYPSGQIRISLLTAYCLATTISSYMPNDGSIGKQIPYTPRYSGHLIMYASYKRWYISYNQSYTGYRFYTTDESYYLQPYNLANTQVAYTIARGKQFYVLSGNINNLYNIQYQLAAGRPMPGINYMLTLKVSM